jgi:hypothetical protein
LLPNELRQGVSITVLHIGKKKNSRQTFEMGLLVHSTFQKLYLEKGRVVVVDTRQTQDISESFDALFATRSNPFKLDLSAARTFLAWSGNQALAGKP